MCCCARRLNWEDDDYLFQAKPTFRVHLPGNIATGGFHRDRDYNHQTQEVNFIVPLTKMAKTASLFIELGVADWINPDLGVGQAICFDGANLLHGSKPNMEGYTRCSIDFRLLHKKDYCDTGLSTVNLGMPFSAYWTSHDQCVNHAASSPQPTPAPIGAGA